MKRIELGVYGIVVELNTMGGGIIDSLLREGMTELNSSTDAAIDGLESLILAQAMAGIDITTPAYKEAIEVAVDAIGNKYGE